MLLDKRYRSECHMNGIKVVFPSANRYDALLKQRHIQVRGNLYCLKRKSLCSFRLVSFYYFEKESLLL